MINTNRDRESARYQQSKTFMSQERQSMGRDSEGGPKSSDKAASRKRFARLNVNIVPAEDGSDSRHLLTEETRAELKRRGL